MDISGAGLGLQAGQAMTNVMGNSLIKKQQNRIYGLQDKMGNRAFAFNENQLQNQQKDVNRNAFYQQQDVQGNANERGILNSSIPQASATNVEQERERRYRSIQDQRDFNQANHLDEFSIKLAQRKQQNIQSTMAMLNGALGGGASGAAAAYNTGGTQ